MKNCQEGSTSKHWERKVNEAQVKHKENDNREGKEKVGMCGVGEGTERKQQTQNYDN